MVPLLPLTGEDEQLTLKLINRPMLILRGENGFICHHKNSNALDASRSVYDIFTLQFSNGAYNIKGQGTTPTDFWEPLIRFQISSSRCMLWLWPCVLTPAGVDGRFWYVNSAGLVCSDGEAPEDFGLELLEHGRLAIRCKNGKYLRGDQGGTLRGDGHSLSSSALWEYWHDPTLARTWGPTLTPLITTLASEVKLIGVSFHAFPCSCWKEAAAERRGGTERHLDEGIHVLRKGLILKQKVLWLNIWVFVSFPFPENVCCKIKEIKWMSETKELRTNSV